MSSGGTWIYREAPVLLPSDTTFGLSLNFGEPMHPPGPTLHEILAGDLDTEVEEEKETLFEPEQFTVKVNLIGRYSGVVTVDGEEAP